MSRKPIIIIASLAAIAAIATELEIPKLSPALAAFKQDASTPKDANAPFVLSNAQMQVQPELSPQSAPSESEASERDRPAASANPVKTRLNAISNAIPAQASPKPSLTVTQAETSEQEAAGGARSQQTEVDESALRYFASKGDTKRLKAEISRLQLLYPNWVPPENPLAMANEPGGESDAFWSLYAEGKFAELRAEIKARQEQEPGWQPPEELIGLLDLAEKRNRIVNSSELKQYDQVIKIAAAEPNLLTCSDVDILWRVSEAFIKTDRQQRGLDAYNYILNTCSNQQERLATLQKAAELLPYAPMQSLLESTDPNAFNVADYQTLIDNLARRFVAEANEDPDLQIDDRYVNAMRQIADGGKEASDIALMGWYLWLHDSKDKAEPYFRAAREKEDTAEISQGLALVLLSQEKPEEAEEVMYPWRSESPDAMQTYLAAATELLSQDPPKALEQDKLTRIATVTVEEKSAKIAQQFGWYARHFKQHKTALRWFETALSWDEESEPTAYGLAVTLVDLKQWKRLASIRESWQETSERIAALKQPTASGSGAVAVNCRNNRPSAASSARTAISYGWCFMRMERALEAANSFEIALNKGASSARSEAAYGKSLAYLRLGLVDDAALTATRATLSQKRAHELQVSILTQRATSAFKLGHYREAILYLDQRAQLGPEPVDLMLMRGHAYLKLKHMAQAIHIFDALAATGNRDAIRSLNEARQQASSQG
ncbi:tetratricopeptide repeat protein [Cohaesibacter marisflavi]|uniref:tetratricopeptide repeat protein n=1 Tax=Cohaesibacter marisflavi TaxID=655353 RepID=UPI0029C85D2E|nr:tetratricopeptide repeat protein [Cohaesibacter marisflavi]